MNPNQEETYPNDDYSRFAGEDYREVKPDEKIWESANEALALSPEVDATDIVVAVKGERIFLEGEVAHEDEKLAAFEAVKKALPASVVENEIKVVQKTRGVLDRVSGNPDALNLTRN